MPDIHEPPVDPLADTNPSIAVRPRQPESRWRRLLGLASLIGAAIFTVATVLVLASGSGEPETTIEATSSPPTATTVPGTTPTTVPPTPQPVDQGDEAAPLPTIGAETARTLLQTPIAPANEPQTITVRHNIYDPFTVIPDRPRNDVITYIAQRGDTIDSIADRFGLEPETIAWSNTRRYIQVLYPGDEVNILPVDGVYYTAIGNKTVAEVAATYNVEDPYTIIDSEYNDLSSLTPDSVIPSGTRVVIPGGEAEEITWNPGLEVDEGTGYVASFATGQSGSCGRVDPTGGAYWNNPLPNGTWVRGFSSYHPGLDLAATEGTPIYAANSGPVLFSGWNNWGYGNTVVLAHGPFTTLYGHMSSVNVRCGQFVTVGQIIGYVGNTGNSSGPHLHFEIRYQDQQTDPSTVPGTGW